MGRFRYIIGCYPGADPEYSNCCRCCFIWKYLSKEFWNSSQIFYYFIKYTHEIY